METNNKKKVYVIGCGIFETDLRAAAARLAINAQLEFLPSRLHEDPKNLRTNIQTAIDRADKKNCYDRIVLGYGICGKGTDGIIAANAPLIIPQVHDCIAILLGSNEEYQKQFSTCPGTYYISTNWHNEDDNPMLGSQKFKVFEGSDDKDAMIEKFGHDNADYVIDFLGRWQENYKRAVFIDNGSDNSDKTAEYTKNLAEQNNWTYERIPASSRLFEKMLTAEKSDDEILLVPPGGKITFNENSGKLSIAQQ
ncbi:MAG: DUF1638 domain-containing protein [Anaerohalosphaeraceae bacterium]|nr:DUF1638 domain-containing protein [Anaerohalosphaeraceae bacterium]